MLARGWCSKHYQRWRNTGRPEGIPEPSRETHRNPAFLQIIQRKTSFADDNDSCWVWTGTQSHGYGVVKWYGRSIRAHRAVYEYSNGPIPGHLHVCHRCDNPLCVRPGHLFLGTDADNHRDKASKGRAAKKLAPEAVIAIRERYQPGVVSMAQLGAEFGVTANVVCAIVNRKIWIHVEEASNVAH